MLTNIYDQTEHNLDYEKKINIYQNDIVDDIINQFIVENNIAYKRDNFIEEIKKNTIDISNAFAILDNRYITCISARICYFDKEFTYDIESASYSDIKPKWYLLNVWRGNRKHHINA